MDPIAESKNSSHFLNLIHSKVFNKNLNAFYHVQILPQLNGPTIIHNGVTYLIGGGIPDYSSCYIINSVDLSLTEIASLLTGRKKHGLVVHLNEIFAVGGLNSDFLSSVERFDGTGWTCEASLNHERVDPTCCSANESLFVFGGTSSSSSTVERFRAGVWDEIHLKVPINLKRIGWFFFDDWIYLLGGNLMTFRTNATSKDVFRFNVHEARIEKSEDLQISDCFDFPPLVSKEKIELIGNKTLVEFDLETKTWKTEKISLVCQSCLSDCGMTDEKCARAKRLTFFKLYTKLKSSSKLA